MNTLKTKLYTLIKAQIGSESLIFSDQNSPRPALPYWTMRVNSIRRLGHEYFSQGVDSAGNQDIFGTREATIAIQRFGNDSDLKCQELVDNLSKTTSCEAWSVQKINCYETSDVTNISQVLDKSVIEPRAAVDLFVRFGGAIEDNVGMIEVVTSSGDTNYDSEIDVVAVASSVV